MDEPSHMQRSLRYYQNGHCSVQWRGFLGALFTGLAKGSGVDTLLVSFRSLGRDMARQMPVTEQDTLEGLEAAINAYWAAMDWGWCRLLAVDGVINIVHGAWPRVPCEQPDLAGKAIAAVVSGAYQRWLEEQGGAPLEIAVLRANWDRPLELCYGC